MKIYASALIISSAVLLFLQILWPGSSMNLSRHLNNLFDGNIDPTDAANLIYFFTTGELMLNYLIFHKHILFKILYCLLIAIDILLIVFLVTPL